jgi:Lipocalin-like domain
MQKTLLVGAVIYLALSAPAFAQSAKDVVGTWTTYQPKPSHPMGNDRRRLARIPKASLSSKPTVAMHSLSRDLTSRASNNRLQGTPEENKAIVQGSISHFGTYAVNEADKTITFHIQISTFPNWDGMDQKRPFTLSGDELKYTVPAAAEAPSDCRVRSSALI